LNKGGRRSSITDLRPLRFLFWSALILPFFVAATFSWVLYQTSLSGAISQTKQIATIVREHVLRVLDAQKNAATALDAQLDGMSVGVDARSSAVPKLLRDIVLASPQTEAIWLIGPNGEVVASSDDAVARHENVAGQDYFEALKAGGGLYLGQRLADTGQSRIGFVLAERRSSAAGGFEGLVLIRPKMTYLEDFWSTLLGGSAGVIGILREDGTVLARYPDVPGILPKLPAASPFYALSRNENEGFYRFRALIDGGDRLNAFSKLAELPAFVRVGLDRDAVLAPWRWQTLALIGAAVLASFCLAILVRMAQARESRLFAEIKRREQAETTLIMQGAHVSALKQAEAKLLLSEQRFRVAVEALAGIVYDWRSGSDVIYRSDGLNALLGYPVSPVNSKAGWWLAQVHPEDQPRLAALRDSILSGTVEDYALEYRLRHRLGHWIHVSDHGSPIRDSDGVLSRVVGSVIDISARKLAEERQQILINELNHRVKNTLATVQSITLQIARNAVSAADMTDRLQERFQALSKAHDQLIRTNWESVDLREFVTDELAPYAEAKGRISIVGPSIKLNATAGVAVALVIHELATNAAKYGALVRPEGHLSIRWAVEDAENRAVRLVWEEQGVAGLERPTRTGFGTRLIERGLIGVGGGSTALEFRPEGVFCVLTLPVPVDEPVAKPEPAAADSASDPKVEAGFGLNPML